MITDLHEACWECEYDREYNRNFNRPHFGMRCDVGGSGDLGVDTTVFSAKVPGEDTYKHFVKTRIDPDQKKWDDYMWKDIELVSNGIMAEATVDTKYNDPKRHQAIDTFVPHDEARRMVARHLFDINHYIKRVAKNYGIDLPAR